MHPITIIGSGLAGYTLAREFRRLDSETPLRMIARDEAVFYSKPQLSAAFVNGKTADTLVMGDVEKMQQTNNMEIVANTEVLEIDTAAKKIICKDAEYEYSKCILATGASVINPLLKGDAVDQVLSVNDLQDYAVFREAVEGKKTIGIIGAGLIGTEFACDLSKAGFDVHVVALGEAPLDRFIPEEVGSVLAEKLAQQGVSWHFANSITDVNQSGDQLSCLLASGETLEVDVLVSAIGIRPDLTLPKAMNLKTDRGVVVDEHFKTSIDDVYALGDCVEFKGVLYPYIAPIFTAAKHLAKTLSGESSAVHFLSMPVVVKTPVYPTTFVIPDHEVEANWEIEKTETGLKAQLIDASGDMKGFVLCGDRNKERLQLINSLK